MGDTTAGHLAQDSITKEAEHTMRYKTVTDTPP